MTKWLRLFVIGLVTGPAVGWASLAIAGVRIESQVVIHAGKTLNNVLELQGSRFRISIQDAASGDILSSTIFDGERIVKLQARDKTYTSMTMADVKTQMDNIKASLPADSQAQLDKAVVAPVYTFKRAAGGETIAGMPCENYAVSRDGVDSGIYCLSTWKHASLVTKADLAPMAKLAEQMKSLNKLPTGDIQMGPDFEKWPGWPLVMHTPDGQERNRVVKVSRVDFPESDFETPAGYTQKPLPMMGAHP